MMSGCCTLAVALCMTHFSLQLVEVGCLSRVLLTLSPWFNGPASRAACIARVLLILVVCIGIPVAEVILVT